MGCAKKIAATKEAIDFGSEDFDVFIINCIYTPT
jgi:hypothetical protein